MEIFVHRDPVGYMTSELEDIRELEEHLGYSPSLNQLNDNSEVSVEITGTWSEIKNLLSQPCFKGAWFDPKRLEKET